MDKVLYISRRCKNCQELLILLQQYRRRLSKLFFFRRRKQQSYIKSTLALLQ